MNAQEHLKTALLLTERGYTDLALEHCDQAVDLAPDSATPLTIKASLLIALGRLNDAQTTLKSVRRSFKHDVLCRIYLAEVLFLKRKFGAAKREIKDARSLPMHDELSRQIDALEAAFCGCESLNYPDVLIVE